MEWWLRGSSDALGAASPARRRFHLRWPGGCAAPFAIHSCAPDVFLAPLHRLSRGCQRYAREVVRLLRVAFAFPTTRVVGYTKQHPIYSDFFDRAGIPGFRFHRPTSYGSLRLLERLGRRRMEVLHLDASSPPEPGWYGPQIVECEGRPASTFFSDPTVQAVFVQSSWAAKDLIASGAVKLLRPACPIPVLRTRPKRAEHPVTLLVVGHGSMIKGYDAIDALWRSLGERSDLRLVIAGAAGHNWQSYPEVTREAYDAADFPSMLERWRRDSRVTMGPIAREVLLDQVYWDADIYLHLARMETFGYSVLEAMARALPVIGTGINAIPEMVRHGETGFVIGTSGLDINAPQWRAHVADQGAHFVRRLVDDPQLRVRLGETGRARVEHAFSVEYRRTVLDRLYRAALDGRDGSSVSPTAAARHFHGGAIR